MSLTKILTLVFLAGSVVLGYILYDGIDTVIAEREVIKDKEAQMKERLMLIREAQIVFQEQMGRYTANWDSLSNFIENGKVPIIQIREEIIPQAYGVEKVIQHHDTLGFIPAKERIFKKNYTMTAPYDGTFQGYNVKVGDKVIKSQRAFAVADGNGPAKETKFIEDGTISSLKEIAAGDAVKKGDILINFWDYKFNPNVEISKIGEVPYEPGTKLNIFAGKVNKSGLIVDVIEVVDPKPADRSRKETSENKARRPLRFGSQLDASTTGNWED